MIDFPYTGPAPIKYLRSLNSVARDQGSMWGRLGWVCGGFHDGISLKQLSDPMLQHNLGGSEDFTDRDASQAYLDIALALRASFHTEAGPAPRSSRFVV